MIQDAAPIRDRAVGQLLLWLLHDLISGLGDRKSNWFLVP